MPAVQEFELPKAVRRHRFEISQASQSRRSEYSQGLLLLTELSVKRYTVYLYLAGAGFLVLTGGAGLHWTKTDEVPAVAPTALASGSNAIAVTHVRGPAGAPVTLEEFADFECGSCGRLHEIIKQVQADSGNMMRVVFRHYPLAMHPNAQAAALAAEAAGMQGDFWEMHDLLFSEQSTWSGASGAESIFQIYAQRLGLDLDRFDRDRASPETMARIAADREQGAERGVTHTPTLFINDWAVPRGAYSVEGLRAKIGMMEATINLKPLAESSSPRAVPQ
jgi:protein-disulfide isomerase